MMANTKMRAQHFVMAFLMAMYLAQPSEAQQLKTKKVDVQNTPVQLTAMRLTNVVNAVSVSVTVYTTLDELTKFTLGPFNVDPATKIIDINLNPYISTDLFRIDTNVVTVTTEGDLYSFDAELTLVSGNVASVKVFGDPHVAIPIPGSDHPLCYDITGYDGDVIEMLSVKASGMVLNAKLIDPKHEAVASKGRSENLFVGEVAILLDNSYVFVSPKEIILQPKKAERGFGWQDGIIDWSPPGHKNIPLKVTSRRLSVPLGAGIRAIIHKKSKTRLDVSFANIYTGIKHEIDGMIGGVAFRVKGHQQITMEDGSKGIILNVGDQMIVLKKGSMGKLECWKLHKPMERIFGDDVIALRRECLFCRNEANKTNMDYTNVFK